MKSLKLLRYASAAAFLLFVAVAAIHTSRAKVILPTSAPAIGAANIAFGPEQLTTNGFALRAFVATRSSSLNCLATFSESNFAGARMAIFCAPRTFSGREGVLVSVFFDSPAPADLILSATLYQEGAQGYAPPVFFPED